MVGFQKDFEGGAEESCSLKQPEQKPKPETCYPVCHRISLKMLFDKISEFPTGTMITLRPHDLRGKHNSSQMAQPKMFSDCTQLQKSIVIDFSSQPTPL